MTTDRRPIDLALDVLVYAPVGLAVSAKELLPKLAARGRAQVSGQVSNAKVVGQFAVQQGQAEASRALARARDEAQERLEQLGMRPGAPEPAVPDPGAPGPATARRPHGGRPRPVPASRQAPPTAPAGGPAAAALAIPDYDSLSASQVVPRLQGLSPQELEAVRAYEAAGRSRKTILGRISQLQTS